MQRLRELNQLSRAEAERIHRLRYGHDYCRAEGVRVATVWRARHAAVYYTAIIQTHGLYVPLHTDVVNE